jgi:hypothetical protein
MNTFDENLFLKGLEQRKATLGSEYVEKNLDTADNFTWPLQEEMTAWYYWRMASIDTRVGVAPAISCAA